MSSIQAASVAVNLMGKAVELAARWASLNLGLNRVSIWCAPENAKSSAILKRFGFKYEGLQRQNEWLSDRFVDHEYYGILREEWLKRKGT